jgi:hypothetical protein
MQHHLHLDVAVRKEKSSCRHADEVADAVVVLIFNSATMEKTIPPCPLVVAGEEEKKINVYCKEIWYEETLT